MCRTREPSFLGTLLGCIPLRELNDLEAVLGRKTLVFLCIEHLPRRWELDPRGRLAHLLVEDLETGRDRDLKKVAFGLEAEPVRDVSRKPHKRAGRCLHCLVATRA